MKSLAVAVGLALSFVAGGASAQSINLTGTSAATSAAALRPIE